MGPLIAIVVDALGGLPTYQDPCPPSRDKTRRRMAELLTESADGTPISFESFGEGPALVLVSGALFASQLWRASATMLAAQHRVYVVDRRGRGRSGDAQTYAPEREVEDLLAVLAAIPGPVDLLGHSSGAILALQTAARSPKNLKRLIAYEPPVFFEPADRISADLPERLDALLARGAYDAAVETFLSEGPRVTEQELAARRGSSTWSQMVATLASTVGYDSRVQRGFEGSLRELSGITIPTLLFVGEASPPRMQSGARTIATRLAHAQIAELPGQQHMAMLSAPLVFVAAIERFLGA